MDLEDLANQVLTCLSDTYFEQRQGSVLDALSNAFSKVQSRALELTRREGGQIPLDFSFAAAVIWGKAVFASIFGGGYFGLFRGGELIPETANRLFTEELKNDDILLLATPLFVTRIGKEIIVQILHDSPKQEWIEKFKETISAKEEQSRFAAIFLGIEIEEVPGEEEVIEILDVPRQQSIASKLKERTQGLVKNFQFPITSLTKTWNRVWSFFHRKGEPEVYLKEQKLDNRGKKFAAVGILIILLVLSIFGTRWQNKRTKRKKEISQLLSQTEEKISQGEKAISANPERAKKLFDEAQDSLGKVAGMQVAKKDIENLEIKLEEVLEQTYNTKNFTPELTIDLEGDIKGLIKLGEKLFSLDIEIGKIIEVDLKNNSKAETLLGRKSQGVGEGDFLAGYLDFLYIFNPEQGIIEANRNTALSEVAIPVDISWNKPVQIETYMGNLYLLDPPSNQIFKYIVIDTGFSKLFNYFTQNVDLTGVKSLAIDGAVYLLYSSDGRVEKYLGGERQEFTLSGFYPQMHQASQIYAAADTEKLYVVLENFILIFNKNGVYEKRLQVEGVSQIEDLVVDETEGKIWILTQGKIYELKL